MRAWWSDYSIVFVSAIVGGAVFVGVYYAGNWFVGAAFVAFYAVALAAWWLRKQRRYR